MHLFSNERSTAITGQRGGMAFLHALRAATIAAVASSCSTMQGQSEPDGDAAISPISIEEEYRPPEIKTVTEEERVRLEDLLANLGYQDVQFITIAYSEAGKEKLTALKFFESEPVDPEVPEGEFLIPPVGSNFETAVVIYTGSPAKASSCGRKRALVLGGTIYRSCNYS
jgi:hypothetical protein